jgi:hypothetical protein
VPDLQHNFEPLTTGALLDKASRLYIRNFSLLLSISAVVHIPLMALVMIRAARNITGTRITFTGAILQLRATLISLFVISPLNEGTAAKAVSDIYLGNHATFAGAWRAAWSRYVTLLKSHFIPVMAILVGALMLVVPGILWYLSYLFITPIVMIEGMSRSRDIRRRSRELVRGHRGKAFVIVAVILLVEILARGGIRTMFRFFTGAAATTSMVPILNECVGIVVGPMVALSITLLYYDLRIRKEGFDLEMLSRTVGNRETQ